MTATRDPARRLQARLALLSLLSAAALLPPAAARAQSASCEQFRRTLAERIEAGGVHGYTMEMVPGRGPVPGGGKVVGTCDGGATRIVYWRYGKPRGAGAASAPAEAAPAPAPAPKVQMPAPAPRVEAPPPAPRVEAPPPAPKVEAPPQAPKVEAPPQAPKAGPPAPRVEAPAPAPMSPVAAAASAAAAVASAAAPAPAPAPIEPPAGSEVSLAQRLSDWLAAYWPWIAAVLAVPLLGWGLAWRSHRQAYDAAGLPRGPKLRP